MASLHRQYYAYDGLERMTETILQKDYLSLALIFFFGW